MKNVTYFIFYCLFVFVALSCQDEKTINLEREEFLIEYPSYLEFDESGNEGVIFALKTQQKDKKDIFIENINLATQEVGNVSLDEFISKTKPEINSIAKIVEDKALTIKGERCHRLVFELTQNNVPLKFIQHYYVKNEKVYVLTFSSEAKEYDGYYKEMNAVLMSFKLKG